MQHFLFKTSGKQRVAKRECLACPKLLPTWACMTGFQIVDFHIKKGFQTAHWIRFKISRVEHTSNWNIAVSHQRMFETPQTGALLVHSPQAIDLNTLQMGTGLCSFSQAHSLLKERARFFGRRPTTAPTAQHSRVYLEGNRSQPLLKERFRAPADFRRTFPNTFPLFRAPADFRTYSG